MSFLPGWCPGFISAAAAVAGEDVWIFITTEVLGNSPGAGSNYPPTDWNNDDNDVYCIAGGGSGGYGGGAGGMISHVSNLTLPINTIFQFSVGTGGQGTTSGAGVAGDDTWFNGATGDVASVWALGGPGGTATAGGVAPTVGGTGLLFAGGNGGSGASTVSTGSGGGGGGAGGEDGAGRNGGNATGFAFGGGGGGGQGGASSSAGTNGASNAGGAGGNGRLGTGGGAAGNPNGGNGSNGGGGGGGDPNSGGAGRTGGAGGDGTEWTQTLDSATGGAGGGGGGAGAGISGAASVGGKGGLYGGGGGGRAGPGAPQSGDGAQGMIALRYRRLPGVHKVYLGGYDIAISGGGAGFFAGIGYPTDDRIVVITVSGTTFGSGQGLDQVFINGVLPFVRIAHADIDTGGGNFAFSEIWAVNVVSAFATIGQITFFADDCAVVYGIYSLSGGHVAGSPFEPTQMIAENSQNNAAAISVSVTPNDETVTITTALAGYNNTASGSTWTNITEDDDFSVDPGGVLGDFMNVSFASRKDAISPGSLSISVDADSEDISQFKTLAAVVFKPATL